MPLQRTGVPSCTPRRMRRNASPTSRGWPRTRWRRRRRSCRTRHHTRYRTHRPRNGSTTVAARGMPLRSRRSGRRLSPCSRTTRRRAIRWPYIPSRIPSQRTRASSRRTRRRKLRSSSGRWCARHSSARWPGSAESPCRRRMLLQCTRRSFRTRCRTGHSAPRSYARRFRSRWSRRRRSRRTRSSTRRRPSCSSDSPCIESCSLRIASGRPRCRLRMRSQDFRRSPRARSGTRTVRRHTGARRDTRCRTRHSSSRRSRRSLRSR